MPKSSATIITMKNIEANTANSMVALPLSSDFSRFMKSFFIFIALLEQHHFGAAAAAHAGADRRSGAATLHRDRIRNEHETEIGRAHVCTPVTNEHLVCRLMLEH